MSVFISYRRGPLSDTMGQQLQQWLQGKLRASVYRDVTNIQIGVKFREHLERALDSCSVGLVLIDPTWDFRRLWSEQDLVRMELERMLQRRVPLALVLLGGAYQPTAEQLPPTLQPLLTCPAYPLAADAFEATVTPIGHFVKPQLSPPASRLPLVVLATIMGLVLLAGGGVAAWRLYLEVFGATARAEATAEAAGIAPAVAEGQAERANDEPAPAASMLAPSAPVEATPLVATKPPRRPSNNPAAVATQPPATVPGAQGRCGGEACSIEGRCTLVDGLLGQGCVAGSDADCKKSSHCALAGECALGNRECVARSDADCATARTCKSSGSCHAREGKCVALSDDDCLGSSDCRLRGRCTHSEGACQITSDADCAKSLRCKAEGKCTFLRNKGCIATKDGDCRISSNCRTAGLCTLRAARPGVGAADGECRPGSAQDCEQSTRCKTQGECALNEFGTGCKRAPPPSDAPMAPAPSAAGVQETR